MKLDLIIVVNDSTSQMFNKVNVCITHSTHTALEYIDMIEEIINKNDTRIVQNIAKNRYLHIIIGEGKV